MKIFKYYKFLFIILITAVACNESEDLLTSDVVEGGLLEPSKSALSYVVGNDGAYSMEFFINQNPKNPTNKITIYKSFVTKDTIKVVAEVNGDVTVYEDSIFTVTSNEILQEEITISDNSSHFISSTAYSYDDLTEGLEVKGASLPTSDGSLTIGDYWNFRIESQTANGKTYEQGYNVSMTVSTRFAGTYKVIDMMYYRINVARPDVSWTGAEVTIKSIDAITYQYTAWGDAAGFGESFYFQIDADGNITYPLEWNGERQVLNDQPLVSLESNPNELANVASLTTTPNIVIKDDVNGKDKLILVYGYLTDNDTGQAREFYEVLEKVVN